MINYDKVTIPEAILMQEEFRKQLKFDVADGHLLHTVAGADISYNKNSNLMYAAIVVLNYPNMQLQSYALATATTEFPYISGFLGFREVPALLEAWKLIPEKPDTVVLDGQGYLHPRRMGIAAHFGVLTSHPTIGCAKSSLYGFYEEPSTFKYASTAVYEKQTKEHIGYALRTKDNTSLVYVSPGYGVTLKKSLQVMTSCIRQHRIPEPTRIAHQVVNDFRTGKLEHGFWEVNPTLELF